MLISVREIHITETDISGRRPEMAGHVHVTDDDDQNLCLTEDCVKAGKMAATCRVGFSILNSK